MTETAGSIVTDEHNAGEDFDTDPDVNAFLSNLVGEDAKKRPSTEEAKEATDNEASDAEKSEETKTENDDPDDAEVEIKVGEETKTAKLRELKRLFGQEAALTQKSQALAEVRSRTDATLARAETALKGMLERAEEAAKPYAEIDWMVIMQQMDPASFKELRDMAKAAEASVNYLKGELDGTMKAAAERAQLEHTQAAQKCRAALEDPATGIPGFGPQLYNEMADFAQANGLTQFARLVDPAALKVVHMAMKYAKGETAAKAAEAKVQKAVAQPKKVLKSGTASTAASSSKTEALARLRRTGSDDDAVEAFLASFNK